MVKTKGPKVVILQISEKPIVLQGGLSKTCLDHEATTLKILVHAEASLGSAWVGSRDWDCLELPPTVWGKEMFWKNGAY